MESREGFSWPGGSEAGDTLVEILVAIAVIAVTAVAILGAFATAISATSEHRTLATADSVMRSFAEYATNQIRASNPPVACATPATPSYVSMVNNFNGTPPATQNDYQVAILTIAYEGPGCPGTPGIAPPELITATATCLPPVGGPSPCGSRGTVDDSIQFVVSQPDQTESAVNSASYTISPASAPAAGGGTITVTAKSGTPFSGATTVNFGATTQAATVGGGGTSVSATIPAESSSQYQVFVSVTTPTGTTQAGPTDLFTYGPTVTNVTPNSGSPGGGTLVTVTGTGFTGTSTVAFGGVAAPAPTFNGNTTLIATAPAGSGTVDITVTNPALPSSDQTSPKNPPADQFSYLMSVTSVSPATGPSTGGTAVVIKGQGFTGVTGVTFEGVPATGVTFVNDGQVNAVSPAGAGTVDVQVTTPSGTTPKSAGDQFAYAGGGSSIAGLGIQLNGASPSPKLSCTYKANGNNSCNITGVGCGGSATFYVETVDGSGNPVVVSSPGGQGVLVGAGATPSGVTIPQGYFTTYAASSNQSVTAQLSPPTCKKKTTESETVTLSATISGNPVSLTIMVSSS